MKVVGLISGGKDSIFNLMECVSMGHEIVMLAHLSNDAEGDEIDSFMFQSVGSSIVPSIAECMGLPIMMKSIKKGSSIVQSMDYLPQDQFDEVETLFRLLSEVKERYPSIEAVSTGAILSSYQRNRVENVCNRLGLISLAYLWKRDQTRLLREMIDNNVDAVLIKVASMGLTVTKHLGKHLHQIYDDLVVLRDRFELNPCGEGGEFETLVLDCPLYKKGMIVLDDVDVIVHSPDAFAEVAYLKPRNHHIEVKSEEPIFALVRSDSPEDDTIPFDSIIPSISIPLNVTSDISLPFSTADLSSPRFSVRTIGDYVHFSCRFSLLDGLSNQMEEIFSSIKLQSDLSHLLFVNLYVRDMSRFGEINKIYSRYFGVNPASRACIQVPFPSSSSSEIFIECIGTRTIDSKSSLHVQSISRWAPACIGPYSQATAHRGVLFLAGQIGLVPASMTLVAGGVDAELSMILRNLQQVLLEVRSRSSQVLTCFVFITAATDLALVSRKIADWSGGTCSMIVNYLQVSALPRGASIELVVMAVENQIDISSSIIEDLPPFHSHPFHFISRSISTDPISFIHSYCFIDSSISIPPSLDSLITALIESLNLSNALVIRIFHHHSIPSVSLHHLLQSRIDRDVAITCIPVISVISPSKEFIRSLLFIETMFDFDGLKL